MDLDSYIAKYNGETRLQRLLLVARTTSDESLAAQAFRMAEEQMKADGNVKRYKEVFGGQQQQQQLGQCAAEEGTQGSGAPQEQQDDVVMSQSPSRQASIPYDHDWVLTTESVNRNDRHVLQGRLSTAQSHLHKEAIRTAYIALAQHDIKTGELQDSLGSLFRATDYCTSRSQTAQISLLILEVCLGLQQYGHVREYVTKVEHTLSASHATAASSPSSAGTGLHDVVIKLKMASGLERLAQEDFAGAAGIFNKLTMTTSSAKMEWPGVASAEDIALYASLLSVATQSRTSILELSEHPEALELVPAMKDLLSQWSRANYVKCMQAFSDSGSDNFVPEGDLYLSGSRWKTLSKTIQEKCLLEYLRPYQSVRLDGMMQLFPAIVNLEDTLVDLMGRGMIQNARIDARVNVLYKSPPKPSVDLAGMECRVLDDMHAMLVRLACLEHDLSVQDPAARGRRGGNPSAAARYDDDDDSDEEFDTPMMDADAPSNMAANPEDLY